MRAKIIEFINALINFLINLSIVYSIIVQVNNSFLIVPPRAPACTTALVKNTESQACTVLVLPLVNKTSVVYLFSTNISPMYFTLLPNSSKLVRICFSSPPTVPPVITNYTLGIYVNGKLTKKLHFVLWFGYYYEFRAAVLVLPPAFYHDKIYVLVRLANTGTLPDRYEVEALVNGRLRWHRTVSLRPGQVTSLYTCLQPAAFHVTVTVKIRSLHSVQKYSKTFSLLKLYYPFELLRIIIEKLLRLALFSSVQPHHVLSARTGSSSAGKV